MRNKNEQIKLRQQIQDLRRRGLSIKKIAILLNCSRSTAANNCVGVEIEDKEAYTKAVNEAHKQNGRAASKAAQERWELIRNSFIEEAKLEWQWIREGKWHPEFLAFLALYWAEGTKKSGYISMTNNDPGVIKLSLEIFNEKCPDKKKEILVKCYPEHDKEECRRFWEGILRQPVKVRDKTWLGKTRRMHSKYGLCVVRFSDLEFYTKILAWIDLWRESILSRSSEPVVAISVSGA